MWGAPGTAAHMMDPYSVEILRGDQSIAKINVPYHWWWARWRWQSSSPRPLVRTHGHVADRTRPPTALWRERADRVGEVRQDEVVPRTDGPRRRGNRVGGHRRTSRDWASYGPAGGIHHFWHIERTPRLHGASRSVRNCSDSLAGRKDRRFSRFSALQNSLDEQSRREPFDSRTHHVRWSTESTTIATFLSKRRIRRPSHTFPTC